MKPGDKVICINTDGMHGPAWHPGIGLRYVIAEVRGGDWPSVSLTKHLEAFWERKRFRLPTALDGNFRVLP